MYIWESSYVWLVHARKFAGQSTCTPQLAVKPDTDNQQQVERFLTCFPLTHFRVTVQSYVPFAIGWYDVDT